MAEIDIRTISYRACVLIEDADSPGARYDVTISPPFVPGDELLETLASSSGCGEIKHLATTGDLTALVIREAPVGRVEMVVRDLLDFLEGLSDPRRR